LNAAFAAKDKLEITFWFERSRSFSCLLVRSSSDFAASVCARKSSLMRRVRREFVHETKTDVERPEYQRDQNREDDDFCAGVDLAD
jgi:hypothetical protein